MAGEAGLARAARCGGASAKPTRRARRASACGESRLAARLPPRCPPTRVPPAPRLMRAHARSRPPPLPSPPSSEYLVKNYTSFKALNPKLPFLLSQPGHRALRAGLRRVGALSLSLSLPLGLSDAPLALSPSLSPQATATSSSATWRTDANEIDETVRARTPRAPLLTVAFAAPSLFLPVRRLSFAAQGARGALGEAAQVVAPERGPADAGHGGGRRPRVCVGPDAGAEAIGGGRSHQVAPHPHRGVFREICDVI